jgi:predicted O-methyltransferase YrrM
LLTLAVGRQRVVELGTGTGWTAISLALGDERCQVTTYDPFDHQHRSQYLELVDRSVRDRIRFVSAPGANGPQEDCAIELLYIDSSHERDDTLAELHAWKRALVPGAVVIFDDYIHPEFPGIREAIEELQLAGNPRGTLFVHEVPIG